MVAKTSLNAFRFFSPTAPRFERERERERDRDRDRDRERERESERERERERERLGGSSLAKSTAFRFEHWFESLSGKDWLGFVPKVSGPAHFNFRTWVRKNVHVPTMFRTQVRNLKNDQLQFSNTGSNSQFPDNRFSFRTMVRTQTFFPNSFSFEPGFENDRESLSGFPRGFDQTHVSKSSFEHRFDHETGILAMFRTTFPLWKPISIRDKPFAARSHGRTNPAQPDRAGAHSRKCLLISGSGSAKLGNGSGLVVSRNPLRQRPLRTRGAILRALGAILRALGAIRGGRRTQPCRQRRFRTSRARSLPILGGRAGGAARGRGGTARGWGGETQRRQRQTPSHLQPLRQRAANNGRVRGRQRPLTPSSHPMTPSSKFNAPLTSPRQPLGSAAAVARLRRVFPQFPAWLPEPLEPLLEESRPQHADGRRGRVHGALRDLERVPEGAKKTGRTRRGTNRASRPVTNSLPQTWSSLRCSCAR